MFGQNKNVVELEQEVKMLEEQREGYKTELAELKMKKRLEQEEITHLQRLNEESLKQKLDGEKLRLEKEHQEKITQLEKKTMDKINTSLCEYHGKIEKRFSEELKNLKEVYGLLMQNLPNVNYDITKHIGDPTHAAIEHKKK